ncbi:MAG: PocR ligand-binding domain-containing protein [Endomicrobia bacterium]|nr:PocR ligand-binding domain-containing protein [Endomicrobiia bacterium]
MAEQIKINAIANIKILEKFQKLFLNLTDIYVTFIDTNGQFITSDRGLRPFCLYLAKLGLRNNCDKCNTEHIAEIMKLKRPVVYECFAGLTEIVSPILIDKKVVGAVLAGQIRKQGQNLKLNRLNQFGIQEISKLRLLYEKVPVFTEEQINSIAQLFFVLINYIFEIEYEILCYKHLDDFADRQKYLAKKAIDTIMQNYSDVNLSLKTLSDKLNVSKFYLCRLFRTHTGLSIKGYIKRVRLKHAIQLLKNPAVPIKEIPIKVGYNDIYYFYRIFKNEFQMTPMSFRQRYLSNTAYHQSKKVQRKSKIIH